MDEYDYDSYQKIEKSYRNTGDDPIYLYDYNGKEIDIYDDSRMY